MDQDLNQHPTTQYQGNNFFKIKYSKHCKQNASLFLENKKINKTLSHNQACFIVFLNWI